MYFLFLINKFKSSVFSIDPNKLNNLKFRHYLLGLVFPFILIINIYNFFFLPHFYSLLYYIVSRRIRLYTLKLIIK